MDNIWSHTTQHISAFIVLCRKLRRVAQYVSFVNKHQGPVKWLPSKPRVSFERFCCELSPSQPAWQMTLKTTGTLEPTVAAPITARASMQATSPQELVPHPNYEPTQKVKPLALPDGKQHMLFTDSSATQNGLLLFLQDLTEDHTKSHSDLNYAVLC